MLILYFYVCLCVLLFLCVPHVYKCQRMWGGDKLKGRRMWFHKGVTCSADHTWRRKPRCPRTPTPTPRRFLIASSSQSQPLNKPFFCFYPTTEKKEKSHPQPVMVALVQIKPTPGFVSLLLQFKSVSDLEWDLAELCVFRVLDCCYGSSVIHSVIVAVCYSGFWTMKNINIC